MVGETLAAQVVDKLVSGDGMQPGLERPGVIPAAALQMHDQQRLLHDVLAVLQASSRPRQAAPRHAAQPYCNTPEQPPVRLVVAASGQPHQRGEIVWTGQGAPSLCLSVGIAETLQPPPPAWQRK